MCSFLFWDKFIVSLANRPRLVHYPQRVIDMFVPKSYRAVLILSCDFELAWAWRFSKQLNGDLEKAKQMARVERENVSMILNLCEKFQIPIVWAIVGHLLLQNCSKENGVAHRNIPRLDHFENRYWQFEKGDWFDDDPCCDWQKAPEWYAPDIIEKIVHSHINHEIACHTFSHIDCREAVCSEGLMEREIDECKNAALPLGVELKSFVFPGHFMGNRKILRKKGFITYRTKEKVLGYPQKDEYGLWQLPTTLEIAVLSPSWTIEDHINYYETIIRRAIKYKRLCHLWFHPSAEKDFLKKILGALFNFINMRRNELYVTTMRDYAYFLGDGVL